jgi:hypothetical protein
MEEEECDDGEVSSKEEKMDTMKGRRGGRKEGKVVMTKGRKGGRNDVRKEV